ncbi:MAG: sigma-70 family RNA polymerase sigma factor [Pseudomonadales bacterium]|jgi:RNA polymerase sigma-70 factor (ECF subfamily)|nr:sigma-70 family RNA polymerase sigma factor [Pseudomonadales bacterium]
MHEQRDDEADAKARIVDKKARIKQATSNSWINNFLAIRPLLFKSVRRMVRPDEIEDIIQETFVLSYAASRKKTIENPRGFMMKTAKNIALNFSKRADKKRHFCLDDLLDDDFFLYMDNVEERYQAQEMFIYFCRAVAELPVCCRRVFILKKVYGLSQEEIAERFGISASMVEKHVAKGMEVTGKYLVDKGYWDESGLLAAVARRTDKEARKP